MVRLVSFTGKHNGFAMGTRSQLIQGSDSLYVSGRYERVKKDKRKTTVKRSAGKMGALFAKGKVDGKQA